MRPLLLIDIDGVLNCVGSIWTSASDGRWEVPPFQAGAGFTIRVPQGTSRRLARLAKSFEMVWATTWMEEAHPTLGALLRLGDPWPVIDFSSAVYEEGKTWKLPNVQEYVQDRPFAWIDDDLMSDAFMWATRRDGHQGIPSLLVRTRPATGMTDEHVEALLGFAARVEEIAACSAQRWAAASA